MDIAISFIMENDSFDHSNKIPDKRDNCHTSGISFMGIP